MADGAHDGPLSRAAKTCSTSAVASFRSLQHQRRNAALTWRVDAETRTQDRHIEPGTAVSAIRPTTLDRMRKDRGIAAPVSRDYFFVRASPLFPCASVE